MKNYSCSQRFVVFAATAMTAASLLPLVRGQLQIDSLGANGQLSWSDPNATGTNYAVQWASSVDGKWMSWQDAVATLTGLGPSGTVSVPMFYRVVTPDPTYKSNATYTYYQSLPPIKLPLPLETNEMRITFMGSMIPLPVRRAQAEMSVFVEVGWQDDANDAAYHGRALDQFVFDCGAGVSANYAAASVNFRRMDKVFINHLHGDHMSDLAHIYCFGPSGDRKSPLFVFGPSRSEVEDPLIPGMYLRRRYQQFLRDGARRVALALGELQLPDDGLHELRGSHQGELGPAAEPIPVGDDSTNDAYAMIPIELGLADHRRRRLQQPDHRRAGSPTTRSSTPARARSVTRSNGRPRTTTNYLSHDLQQRHQTRNQQRRSGLQRRQGRGRVHPRDGHPARYVGVEADGTRADRPATNDAIYSTLASRDR